MATALKKKQVLTLTDKLTNMLLSRGKKSVARKILADAFDLVKKAGNQYPDKVLEKAIENLKPRLEVKSKRVGGSNYQIPVEVSPERQLTLALRWLIGVSRERKGQAMAQKLATEILEASKGQGNAIKKKDDVHRMAEANKAFAHLAKYF